LALLILAIKGIQWENLIAGINSANPVWLTLAVLAVFMGLFLKLWRWAILVKNYHIRSSLARLYSSYFIGQAVNIILPFRGGDLVRIGYFTGEGKIIPEVASTVVLEKYLDFVALVVCGILVSVKFSIDNIMNLRGLFLPLAGIMTLLLLLAILYGNALWEKIRITSKLPKRVIDWIDRWVEASQWLKNPRQVLPGILLTIFIWCVMWSTNILVFNGLGITLGGTAAGLVLISVYVGLFPALMPGNIGPFYFFALLALLPFGISRDQAFTYAVVLHAIVTVPPLLCGAIGLFLRSERAVTA
jgi:uncharacterized protein (TIRG00374 family)